MTEASVWAYLAAAVHKAGGRLELTEDEVANGHRLAPWIQAGPVKGGVVLDVGSPGIPPPPSKNSVDKR